MPGIHPSSRRQVKWAFAAEARGQFPKKMAREWAHRWKCWTWDKKARGGGLPKDCKDAIDLLQKIHQEHPSWAVPKGVKIPKRRKKHERAIVYQFPRKPEPILMAAYKAPRPRRAGGMTHR